MTKRKLQKKVLRKSQPLTPSETLRYSRHLLLEDFGLEKQLLLRSKSVLVFGAGGLGSPALLYLAAAGVGRMGVVDFDRVDKSNLQRQILFSEKDLGLSKAKTALKKLKQLNKDIQIQAFSKKADSKNILSLLKGYDVVIDGTDNFASKYLINDACGLLKIPLVSASILGFEGQVSVFHFDKGPCYRCLYPQPPPPEMAPTCSEAGVLGVLPGMLGILQATEALKILCGLGTTLNGRLLHYEALQMQFSDFEIFRRKDCPLCGDKPTLKKLIDYEEFCQIPGEGNAISVLDLSRWRKQGRQDITVLDVREKNEREICQIQNSMWIPMGELLKKINDDPHSLNLGEKNKTIIVYCKSGVRSARISGQLRLLGYTQVKNLRGGILAWIEQVEPKLQKY